VNSFNLCTFIGRVGSDPKRLTTGSGKSFTRFRLAVDNPQKKSDESATLWLTVLVWPEVLAKVVVARVVTGSLVLVSGRIAERPYTTAEGEARTSLELTADTVEFLETSKPAAANQEPAAAANAAAQAQRKQN